MSDLISRQAAIDVVKGIDRSFVKYIEELPSAQPDLIDKIQNGINATNANDNYSCGMRNGMRWCMSLVDDKEPSFEECPSAQPEIIRCKDCKWYGRVDKRRFYRGMDCLQKHIDTIVPDRDFCSKAERRGE